MKKKFRLTSAQRHALTGLVFLIPFLIGTALFFLYPTVTSLLLSFGDTDDTREGIYIIFQGFQNYVNAFTQDTLFVPKLLDSVETMLIETPLTVILSLMIAIMLNKVQGGKGVFRVIYILPFLLGTGDVMSQLISEGVDDQVLSLVSNNVIPREYIDYLSTDLLTAIDTLFGIIVKVLWSCGVQTLLFLSAIQSISPALYESAYIDGANQYEVFWRITLPMVSPMLLLNLIYTVVTAFTAVDNPLLEYIKQLGIEQSQHGYAAAIGWIYFAVILLFVGVIALIVGRYSRKVKTA
ncbi:MAG: sugar ABC transporter permease [Clostridia bacterium]|nr:sugar ABC transporter permease [Clostridia bacterium]